MQELLSGPWLRARRALQTNFVLQKNALKWALGKRSPAPVLMREIFEDLGTTYVKLGQLIASMPSIFPDEYVKAFQGCLDQTNPLPWSTIERVIRKELKDPAEHFSFIDPEPLASASIAQVHAAELVTGEDVVIKVQRPNARSILKADLSTVHLATRAMELIAPRLKHLSLADMVGEIRSSMMEECDFEKEAENIEIYRDFLGQIGSSRVKVPKVYPEASTSKILTMERFYGVPLTDIEQVRRFHTEPEQALIDALNVWFASVSQCRIYHADLHSGNVMMLDSGQIGFIDFGIVGRIGEEVWQALMTLGTSLPACDFEATADAMIQLGATGKKVDRAAFAKDIETFYNQCLKQTPVQSGVIDDTLEDMILQMSSLAKRYGIRFPRSFTLLIKQFLYFDRYTQALAPDLHILDDDRILIQPDQNH